MTGYTRWFADGLAAGLEDLLEAALLELAAPLVRLRLVHHLLQDHDVELTFHELDLTLGDLLLAATQELLLVLLLQRGLCQLLLATTQLLNNYTHSIVSCNVIIHAQLLHRFRE